MDTSCYFLYVDNPAVENFQGIGNQRMVQRILLNA
jgi:hypothetical protein